MLITLYASRSRWKFACFIFKNTDVNIDELIKDKIFQRKTLFNLEDTLKSVIGNRAIYPNAYNDDNCITRYFDFNFIDEKKFLDSYNFKEKLNNHEAKWKEKLAEYKHEVDAADFDKIIKQSRKFIKK